MMRPPRRASASCSSSGSVGAPVVDLGDITTARGAEMLLPIWVQLWGALGTPMFNFKIAR